MSKKKKKIKKPDSKLFCHYTRETIYSRSDFNPSDYTGTYENRSETKLVSVSKEKFKTTAYQTEINLFGNTSAPVVYVVCVSYDDGDTFGSDYGNVSFFAAFSDKTAAEQVKTRILKLDNMHEYDGYLPWCGYFATLGSVNVQEMTVV